MKPTSKWCLIFMLATSGFTVAMHNNEHTQTNPMSNELQQLLLKITSMFCKKKVNTEDIQILKQVLAMQEFDPLKLIRFHDKNCKNVYYTTLYQYAMHTTQINVLEMLEGRVDFKTAPCIICFDEAGMPWGNHCLEYTLKKFSGAHVVELLLRNGVSADARTTPYSMSPLLIALMTGQIPVAKILLQYGADIHSPTVIVGKKPGEIRGKITPYEWTKRSFEKAFVGTHIPNQEEHAALVALVCSYDNKEPVEKKQKTY
jgi:hypothetical protein